MARLIDADAVLSKIDELIKENELDTATKYGNETPEQADNSYSTWMKYEIADFVDDIRDEIVNAPTVDYADAYSKGYSDGYQECEINMAENVDKEE